MLREIVAVRGEWEFDFVEGSTDMWTITQNHWEEDEFGDVGAWVPFTVTHFVKEKDVMELVKALRDKCRFAVCC